MSRRPMLRRLTLGAATATALVALLTGCSVIEDLLPNSETRDEDTGEITEGGDTDVFTLAEGDCIDDNAEEGEVSEVPTVPCTDPHTWEVFANVTMSDEDFPGDVETGDYADEQCLAAFTDFVGLSYDESKYEVNYYTPTSDSWASGDRTINCLVGGTDGITGSLRGVAE